MVIASAAGTVRGGVARAPGRGAVWGIAVAGLAAAGGVMALAVTSDHVDRARAAGRPDRLDRPPLHPHRRDRLVAAPRQPPSAR